MNLLTFDQITGQIENIIHKDTQLHANSIDLTVNEIHAFTQSGSLDFGGSEYAPAKTEIIKPEKCDPDDDYGWWDLTSGRYNTFFNEQMSGVGKIAIISPHHHARAAGIVANTSILSGNGEALHFIFDVPDIGCKIKENARFATVYIWSL